MAEAAEAAMAIAPDHLPAFKAKTVAVEVRANKVLRCWLCL
jgi:hypothetical protein